MGTWGPAIFSDDSACDVRDAYRDLLGDGLTSEAATKQLTADWGGAVSDCDVGPVFWLALAHTQWKCGRPVEFVMRRALEVIDSGVDLRRWQDEPRKARQREKHLSKLRAMLVAKPPPPKRIRKSFRDSCEWEVGTVVRYTMKSGRHVLFRVINYHEERGGRAPVVEFLHWREAEPPSQRVLSELRVLRV